MNRPEAKKQRVRLTFDVEVLTEDHDLDPLEAIRYLVEGARRSNVERLMPVRTTVKDGYEITLVEDTSVEPIAVLARERHPFKVGDRVLCVWGNLHREMREGDVYVIREIKNLTFTQAVYVEGNHRDFTSDCFVLAEKLPFKVGDRVCCVLGSLSRGLIPGDHYTVSEVVDFAHTQAIRVEGNPDDFSSDRFVLAHKPTES